MTKIKILIIKPVKEFGLLVFFPKQTQKAACQNREILSTFNVNLGAEIKYKRGSLYYGSYFQDIAVIKNLFSHQKYKDIIVNIIQNGSRYHLSLIEEATRKSDIETMLLRGNHTSARSALNVADLEKEIYKEV